MDDLADTCFIHCVIVNKSNLLILLLAGTFPVGNWLN
jgi:hypothetical protein